MNRAKQEMKGMVEKLDQKVTTIESAVRWV